jgi:murein DD-endopeptidase MepM/ murein hydrolase activator NlpD
MKTFIKFLLLSITIVSCFLIAGPVYADTLQDYYNDLDELEKEKQEYLDKQQELGEDKEQTQAEIAQTNTEIAELGVKLVEIEVEIEVKKEKIKETQSKIEETKVEINNRDSEIRIILRYFQKSRGFSQSLKFLFGASDINDLSRRFVAVSRLSDHNKEIIDEMERLLVELNDLEIQLKQERRDLEEEEILLKENQDELEILLNDLDKKLQSIGADLTKLYELNEDYDYQIAALEGMIDYFEGEGCGINQLLSECVDTVPDSTKFYAPTDGGTITSNFGPRCFILNGSYYCDYHSGIDISYGYNNVYAPAAGKVTRVVSDPWGLTAGGNAVILNHVVDGVKYTTAFYHLGSISVSQGDIVTHFDKIGTIGNTGYATTGAHLHFTVTYNWRYGTGEGSYTSYSDYKKYYFDPRLVLNFPSKGSTWYGRDIGR